MLDAVAPPGDAMGDPQQMPRDSGLEKSINEAYFLQIEKPECEFVINWGEFAMPEAARGGLHNVLRG
jgi:hypothetical protein